MSRYVDAEWLLGVAKLSNGIIDIDDIYNAPSVDIVRCDKCKFWKDFECQCDWASTDHEGGASYSLDRNADDFCSYGEEKE